MTTAHPWQHAFLNHVVSFTLMCRRPQNKTWKVVDGLSINDFSRAKMDATAAELVDERDTAMDFLSQWLSPPAGQQQQHVVPLKTCCSRLWGRSPFNIITVPAGVRVLPFVCVRLCRPLLQVFRKPFNAPPPTGLLRLHSSWENVCVVDDNDDNAH